MFSSKVISQLQWYVYAYIDPRTDKIFYVGKGFGNRAFEHLTADDGSEKVRIIQELLAIGISPKIDILRHGLTNEESKLVESVCIDFAGLNNLSNAVKGKLSNKFGRASTLELKRRYDAPPANVTEPSLAININQSYRHGLSARELYECTRGIWPLSKDRFKAKYALAVFQEVIVEVFEIKGWYSAGEIFSEREYGLSDKSEFIGNIAPTLSKKYVGSSLIGMFSGGKQFPVRYLNIKNAV